MKENEPALKIGKNKLKGQVHFLSCDTIWRAVITKISIMISKFYIQIIPVYENWF